MRDANNRSITSYKIDAKIKMDTVTIVMLYSTATAVVQVLYTMHVVLVSKGSLLVIAYLTRNRVCDVYGL